MVLRIGIENGMEGRTLAWALEHPGCFSYGLDEHDALHRIPAAFQEYVYWIAQHDPQPWVAPVDQPVQVDETWEVYFIDDDFELSTERYEVNAWFLHDWKPLVEEDVSRGLKLLAWSRADLQNTVAGLDQETLDSKQPGERWSIAGILKHIGGAEWWYLDRLGLASPRSEVPEDPMARLDMVRALLERTLPELVGSRLVVGTDGEFWSPRKMLRRAVWHERDHAQHIRNLLAA
jgi:hypothetical protein